MSAEPVPSHSFSHQIGQGGLLFVECFHAQTRDEVYVVTFEKQSVAFTRIDFNNYINDLIRMRDAVASHVAP